MLVLCGGVRLDDFDVLSKLCLSAVLGRHGIFSLGRAEVYLLTTTGFVEVSQGNVMASHPGTGDVVQFPVRPRTLSFAKSSSVSDPNVI